jgi:site-specific recombinase XerD
MKVTACVDEYRLYCRAKNMTPGTWRWYESKLRLFAAYLRDEYGIAELESIRSAHVNAFLDHLRVTPGLNGRGPRSTFTLKSYYETIRAFMAWCVAEELLDAKVRERIPKPKVAKRTIKTLTREQYDLLVGAADCECTRLLQLRDKALVALLLTTGLRAQELCSLRMCDLFFGDQGYVRVIGKGDKQREVGPLGVECQRALRRYLRGQEREPEQTVFLGRRHEPLTPSGLDRILYRLRDFAGPDHFVGLRISAHTLRHTFAVNYMLQGGDIYTLSLLLGHTSVAVTQNYLRDFQQREARKGGSVLDAF